MTRTTCIAFASPSFEKVGQGGFAQDSTSLKKRKIPLHPLFPKSESA
jgi:hypothetical protein